MTAFKLHAQEHTGTVSLNQTLTWWIFKNESAQLVSGVQHATVATGLARVPNGLLLRIDVLKREKGRATERERAREKRWRFKSHYNIAQTNSGHKAQNIVILKNTNVKYNDNFNLQNIPHLLLRH